MPNPNFLKYSLTNGSGTIKSGNVVLSVEDNKEYGPTSTTGYYVGVNPPNGGYTIYYVPSSGQPRVHIANNDTELIFFAKSFSGTNITTVVNALTWFQNQSNYLVTNINYPNLVTDNLTQLFDASFVESYPKGGTTWYNLLGTANATLVNGPTYASSGQIGYLSFDGTNDYANLNVSAVIPAGSNAYTVSVWLNRNRNNVGYEEILAQWTNANSGNSFFFGFNGSNVRFSDSWNNVTVAGAGNTGVWMNLVGVNTGSNAYIYLNGTLAATKGSALTYTGTGNFIIGRQGELDGEYFGGLISDIQIYSKALSEVEIRQNFYGGEFVTSGLLCYLDASNLVSYGGSGVNWYDLSGNGRQGYVRGTPTFGTTFNGYLETGANQTTNYIELPESAPQSLTNSFIFSIDWWCTMKDTGTGRYQQSMVNSAGGNVFIIGKDTTSFSIYATTLVSGTAPTYTVDVPVHLAVTSDGTYQYFYKNGVLTSTWSAAWGDMKTVTGWIIDQEQDSPKGSFDANQNTYGWWHLTRMYNKVLTANEVLQNFRAHRNRFGV